MFFEDLVPVPMTAPLVCLAWLSCEELLGGKILEALDEVMHMGMDLATWLFALTPFCFFFQ